LIDLRCDECGHVSVMVGDFGWGVFCSRMCRKRALDRLRAGSGAGCTADWVPGETPASGEGVADFIGSDGGRMPCRCCHTDS
jgi:hypothetical protein